MSTAGGATLRPADWSWQRTGVAIVAALIIHFGLLLAIGRVADAAGYGTSFRDNGDLFEQATAAVQYTDERVAAIANGLPVPDPPQLRGDVRTARIAYAVAMLDLVLLSGVVIVATGKRPRAFAHDMGLDRSPFHDISRPVIAAALAVAVIAVYAAAVRAAGLDALAADPAPKTLLRDDTALALFGLTTVIFAPVAEELLFRGLVLRRLLSFGQWPAITGSAALFAAWHASPAVLPLLLIGGILGWLYLRSATLWQPIAFHVLFNVVSFVQFAGHR